MKKRILAALIVAAGCGDDGAQTPATGSSMPVDGATGSTGSTGSTGGADTGTTGDGMDTAGFVAPDPEQPPGLETAGGEGPNGEWYSECFTIEADFPGCDVWCADEGFTCLYVEAFPDVCVPFGDGWNLLGECERNTFEVWPPESAEPLRLRCVCDPSA